MLGGGLFDVKSNSMMTPWRVLAVCDALLVMEENMPDPVFGGEIVEGWSTNRSIVQPQRLVDVVVADAAAVSFPPSAPPLLPSFPAFGPPAVPG
jgi:hypothetical protein